MLDVARVVAVVFALVACGRARYGIGAIAWVGIAALLAWEIGAPLAGHATGEGGPGAGFSFVFLGPSRLAPRTWATLAEALLAGGASAIAFRRARPLRPEGEVARSLDRVALRFLFVAVLDGLVAMLDLLMATLMREP